MASRLVSLAVDAGQVAEINPAVQTVTRGGILPFLFVRDKVFHSNRAAVGARAKKGSPGVGEFFDAVFAIGRLGCPAAVRVVKPMGKIFLPLMTRTLSELMVTLLPVWAEAWQAMVMMARRSVMELRKLFKLVEYTENFEKQILWQE